MIYTITLNPALDRTISVKKITYNKVTPATKTVTNCGGKGFNVSRSLKLMGIESIAIGLIGGRSGQEIKEKLHSEGVQTDLLSIIGETRINTVILEEGSSNHIKINESGPTISRFEQEALFSKVRQHASSGDLWIISGSIPGDTPKTFYADLISMIHKINGKVYLDTSGIALEKSICEKPSLIKPNLEEFQILIGKNPRTIKEIAHSAKEIHQLGINAIAISLGENGLIYSRENIAIYAPAPKVKISNPTGAGDALLSGIIWATLNNFPFDHIAAWGVATGTASAVKDGVEFCTLSEILPYFEQVISQVSIL